MSSQAAIAKQLAAEINSALKTDVVKLGSDPMFQVTHLPTGVLPIDMLLLGGAPRGRFIAIKGDWSTLKSYIGYMCIAETQRAGGLCSIIDMEHSYDAAWGKKLGIDNNALIIQRPATGEAALDIAEAMVRSGVDLIVFDSVTAASPQAEQTKRLDGESVQPGRLAALMSIAMRKLTTANTKTAIIWIAQTRINIGVTFGNPEVMTGGKAMGYYNSYIIDVKKVGKVTRDEKTFDGEKYVNVKVTTGQKFRATVEKSKLSKPFRDVFFTWSLEQGGRVDDVGFLVAQGLELGFIQQTGTATWQYGDLKTQGKDKFQTKLREQSDVLDALRQQVTAAVLAQPDSENSPGEPAPARKRRVIKKKA